MKFKSNIKALREALAKLSAIPGAKAAGPAANLIKIECGMEGIDLSRATAEGFITVTREAEISDSEGTLILDYGKLSSILGRVSSKDSESLTIDAGEKTATIQAGRAKADLAVLPVSMFAPAPEKQKAATSTLDALCFLEGMRIASMALSTEVDRPELLGVCFRKMAGKQTMFGTDGRRFHAYYLAGKSALDCLVPIEASNAILSAFAGETGKLKVSASETMIQVESGTVRFASVLSVEKPPNVEPMMTRIDKEKPAALFSVNRSALLDAIKTAAVGGYGDRSAVEISLSDGVLHVVGDNRSDTKIDIDLDTETESEDFKFAVSSNFMLPALDAMSGDTVTLEYYEDKFKAVYMRGDDRIVFLAPQVI